jgi:CubicO group peptidase (beta-lactamase class C family)
MLALLLLAALDPAALDQSVRDALARHPAPGAVVAVVRNGEAVYLQGHGAADAPARRAVDPERSAFRTASISKVITSLVVLDQVRQGRLRLDEDISGRLTGLPAPLTLAQLLTHTAGFDDMYIGTSARSFDEAVPLAVFLGRFRPARIVPPGEVPLYSNYGFALAGFLAEQAAGRPFASLAAERVFAPLEMRHSSFVLPPELRADAARPHAADDGGGFVPLDWDYMLDAPAGMLMSSGADMARLLVHLLRDPAREALQPQFTPHPALRGAMGWGFFLGDVRGHRWAGHDGGYAGAAARLRLFPGVGAGYFIAVNASAPGAVQAIAEAIEAQILPEAGPASKAPVEARPGDPGRFTGWYRAARYPRATLDKVGLLFGALGAELRVARGPEGSLIIPGFDGAAPRRFVQAGDLLWAAADGGEHCAFRAAANGRVTHLFTDGTTAFERVAWWRIVVVQRALLLVCLTVFLALVVGTVRRQWLPALLHAPAMFAAHAYLLHFACLGLVLQVLTPASERETGFAYGLPAVMGLVQVLPFLGLAATVWFLVRLMGARAWKTPAALVTAGVLLIYAGWLAEWNLLGWRY